jgi:hypothetical protein
VKNVEFDGHFVHASHPRAALLSRNASFEQIPAKCTAARPSRRYAGPPRLALRPTRLRAATARSGECARRAAPREHTASPYGGRYMLHALYNRSLGEYPRRCGAKGYFTVMRVHMCCAYAGWPPETTPYGPPSSA